MRLAALLALLLVALAAGDFGPVLAQSGASSDTIRDRILSRIERGRMLRAPSISGGRTAAGGGAGYESVLVAGKVRLFVRYTPNRLLVAGKPGPVVFMLHADGSRADQVTAQLGFNKLAEAEGFVAVYPQAGSDRWISGRDADTDDVEFLNRLADALVSQAVADPQRLFIAGVSGGGTMALRLACSESSRFAAYGLIGSVGPAAAEFADCRPSPPRIALITGPASEDTLSAADAAKRGQAIDTIGQMAQRLGCQSLTEAVLSNRMQKSKWAGCTLGAEIELVRAQERLVLDRAAPELWSLFRRIGL